MKTLLILLGLLISASSYSQERKKSEPLPDGATQDWLNNIRDENGNRIIPGTNNDAAQQTGEDPVTDALQRKIFNAQSAGESFGYNAKSAGDVNGDGYDDIIVGAYTYASDKGRAYIFFGGAVMNTVADIIFTGENENNRFGASASSAGDVNGDGYDDVIVGAWLYASDSGRAYIYFGGAAMNNVADLIFNADTGGERLGYSVSTAGDVNGDGYSDVIIGANGFSTATGKANIYFGGMFMDNIADVTLNGEYGNNNFGISVSSAGDVNGDGYADVIVGANNHYNFTGRVYVFYGGAAMNNTADVRMSGEAVNNYFGFSVSSAGDLNGDGYSDVITGANGYSSFTGKVYVYFGGSSMDSTADLTMTGEAAGNYFGSSVSSAGDINGDGYSDLIIGAYRHTGFTGKAYLYFGGSNMNNVSDMTLTGEGTGHSYGVSVSSAGDVNGDGYDDIFAGASGYASGTGRVYLYDYFPKNDLIQDLSFNGESSVTNFGFSVASAGDVNGDGFSDIIAGAYAHNTFTGRAFIYYGGTAMDNTADVTMTGQLGFNYFGYSVSTAGDVNGDGYSDVIVGAYGHTLNTGRAYIYYGGAAMDNVIDLTMNGESSNTYFGFSVSAAGDVNADGYGDVIVGSEGDASITGKAFIFYGGAAMNNVADVTMTGEATNHFFGCGVSSAGDVNADGYNDVIVGAEAYASSTGRAYVYYGGASMNNVADVTITGETVFNNFGRSVSSAGDVNKDGYADIIIGAFGYGSNTGRAYVLYGGSAMDNIPDIVMTGETNENYFGISASSVGDINADGYSDIIVGANNNNASTGKAYIYYGGYSMNNIPDITVTGESTNNFFGTSVSSAGDVNGDGYPDVITGARGVNVSTGRTYLYLGSAISAKPVLLRAKDVPDDQGGKVTIKWSKSSLETSSNNITNYLVYRSVPPGVSGYQWSQIADVTAVDFPFYYYDASTLHDSSAGSSANTYFLIKARNGNTGEIWNSNIIFGRSIDNITPPAILLFSAMPSSGNVRLNWKRSSAPDLFNYILYRSTSPSIDPNTEPVFSTTTDSTYLDAAPLSGTYYYFIVAQDIHNNKSPVAVASPPSDMTLNLTMLVQGFYNASFDMMVEDTVRVYLRNSSSPYAIVDSSISKVNSSGNASFTFANAVNGVDYYIQLKHRNSIETWSMTTQQFTSSVLYYSFTNSSAQAYGNNQISVDASPVRFGIYGGDVNQDGSINLSDIINVYNDAAAFTYGYVETDVTGDNITNLSDLLLSYNNAAGFVMVKKP